MIPRPSVHVVFFIASIIAWGLTACDSGVGTDLPLHPPYTSSGGLIQQTRQGFRVYFTDPPNSGNPIYRGGPDEALVAEVKSARVSVDVAIYDFNLWNLRDALIDAHRRGIKVRMVTDSNNMDGEEIRELVGAGIPVIGDRRESLMHHKFAIIDRQVVWTGSMNFTIGSAYHHNNNLIAIRSSQVAQDYLVEFEEMFVNDLFGENSPANTPYPQLVIDKILVEVLFSPDDRVENRLVDLINEAKESIHFLAYSFTSDSLAKAMLERAKVGVKVTGLFDTSQYHSNIGTEFNNFALAGLDVRLDSNPGLMHHKVIIIDRQIVITGSYNFSRSAETENDENVLILYDAAIAEKYLKEFEKLFVRAKK